MSVASNDDLSMKLNEKFPRGSLSEDERNVTSASLSYNQGDEQKESVIDIDGYIPSEDELLEEIQKTKESINNRDFLDSNQQPSQTLREVNDDDLRISIELGSESKESPKDNLIEFSGIKKRKGLLAKILGPNKAEREYIREQEAIQRAELRKKADFILSKDKEQKARVLIEDNDTGFDCENVNNDTLNLSSDELSNSIRETNGSLASNIVVSSVDRSNKDEAFKSDFSSDNIYENTAIKIFDDNLLDNKQERLDAKLFKPSIFSNYDKNIKQLELKISHFNLVLGRNILPDRFKRRKKHYNLEPKEELSEIDKLYLAAFSDVTIPEEDVDLDEDVVFVEDPAEIEDLFDLADESLTDSMESAIYSQLSSFKQDIDEKIERENAKSVNQSPLFKNRLKLNSAKNFHDIKYERDLEAQKLAQEKKEALERQAEVLESKRIEEQREKQREKQREQQRLEAQRLEEERLENAKKEAKRKERKRKEREEITRRENALKAENLYRSRRCSDNYSSDTYYQHALNSGTLGSEASNYDHKMPYQKNNASLNRETTRIRKEEAFETKDGAFEKNANVLVRYGAFMIDMSFVSFVCAIISFFMVLNTFSSASIITSNPLYLIEFVLVFVKSVIYVSLLYYAISYTVFKTSLGLKILSYELKSYNGERPKLRQILVRVLCMPVNLLLTAGILGENSLHDKLSKTKLVKI